MIRKTGSIKDWDSLNGGGQLVEGMEIGHSDTEGVAMGISWEYEEDALSAVSISEPEEPEAAFVPQDAPSTASTNVPGERANHDRDLHGRAADQANSS